MHNVTRGRRLVIALGALSLTAGVTLLISPPTEAITRLVPAPAPGVATHVAARAPMATQLKTKSTAYKVTIVARSCNAYTDIMANRARNNIQESLQDLGPDTLYSNGQPISPTVEQSVPSQVSNCHPLVGWQFKLGTGITGKTQANDFLSTVTGAFPEAIKTVPQQPLLDPYGNNTGQKIDGATTITLNSQQVALAQSGSSLWIQGGLVNDPLLNGPTTPKFDPPQAFGALRCAIDNLNGDNVEWISFPSGTNHVFCYYYTVSPPPEAATIIIKKAVVGEPNNNQTFQFAGNVSYNPSESGNASDNPFYVTAGSNGTTFIRAADTTDPWTFYEVPSNGFIQVGVQCVHAGGSTVTVPTTVNQANPVSITLKPSDVVTCTFTNQRDIAGMSIEKITTDGVGTFNFTASSPSGTNTVSKSVTTVSPGAPTQVLDISGGSGSFSSREDLPAGAAPNSWTLTSLSCNGTPITPTPSIGQTVTHPIAAGTTAACTYVNTPNGRIIIRKMSVGGKGPFFFSVIPLGGFPLSGTNGGLSLKAVTSAPDVITEATDVNGHSTNLPYQKYAVIETATPPNSNGSWVLTSVNCDAADSTNIKTPALSGATFTMTDAKPTITCDFTNALYKPSTLVIHKTIAGDAAGRTGDVMINTQCNNALTDNFVSPAGHPGPFTSNTLSFTDFLIDGAGKSTLQCRIRETQNGAATGVRVKTSWTVKANNKIVDQGTDTSFLVPITDNTKYIVNVTDKYTAPVTETPSPSPSGGGSGGSGGGSGGNGGGGSGDLPHTGANPLSWFLIFGGIAAIIVGAIMGRRPRRSSVR